MCISPSAQSFLLLLLCFSSGARTRFSQEFAAAFHASASSALPTELLCRQESSIHSSQEQELKEVVIEVSIHRIGSLKKPNPPIS